MYLSQTDKCKQVTYHQENQNSWNFIELFHFLQNQIWTFLHSTKMLKSSTDSTFFILLILEDLIIRLKYTHSICWEKLRHWELKQEKTDLTRLSCYWPKWPTLILESNVTLKNQKKFSEFCMRVGELLNVSYTDGPHYQYKGWWDKVMYTPMGRESTNTGLRKC